MSEFPSKVSLALLALALLVAPVRVAQAEGPKQPSPFQFEIEEITLKLGDEVVLRDHFDREGGLRPEEVEGRRLAAAEGPEYRVDLGQISAAQVRDGVLRIDQDMTSNIWHGPRGNYGHTLHRNDSYVAMLTLPVDLAGASTFLGREAYGLEYTVRLRKPNLGGFEKLKIGLMDLEAYASVGAISVGRLPLPALGVAGSADAGKPENTNLLELESRPAIVLGRVEEPAVRGEIVLDYAPIERFEDVETLELILRVGPDGRLSGAARLEANGKLQEMRLAPRSQEPREFYQPRESVPADARLAATLFVETLPGLEVRHVAPSELAIRDLADADRVRFRIEGFGFGPDSRVEIVPRGGEGEPIRAAAIHRQRAAGTPEGTVLLADIGLPARIGSYGLRVTTGGQTTVVEDAVRVYSASAAAATTTAQVP